MTDDNDPAVLEERIRALDARVSKLEETNSRVIWALLAAAAMLILEPIQAIVRGGTP